MTARPTGLLVFLMALGLSVHALDRWPLYVAELWTWEATSGSLAHVLAASAADKHPPLQPLAAWLMRQLADVEWVARVPSAAASLAAVLVLGRAVRMELGSAFAVLAMGTLVLTPAWVTYAGIMRPYAPSLLVGAALLVSAQLTPKAPMRGALALGVLGVLALHLHYANAAILGAAYLGAALGTWRGTDKPLRHVGLLVGSAAVAALSVLPWMLHAGRDHLDKTRWGDPSLTVLRALLFEVDDLHSWGMHGLLLLALAGLLAAAWQRRWVLLGCGLGAVALPLMLSVNYEIRIRSYALLSLLPVVVTLAVVGARAIWGRPLAWGLLVLVGLGPDAVEVARLPSAPQGRHGEAGDDGVFDVRRDVALVGSLLPEGYRLVVPQVLEPNVYAHYAPDATVLASEEPTLSADWRFKPGGQRGRTEAPAGAACVVEAAFALDLSLPDEESCDLVYEALETGTHPPWLRARAARTEDPAEQERLLRLALGSQDPSAHLSLSAMLQRQGRLEESLAVVEEGLSVSIRWGWAFPSALLVDRRAELQAALLKGEGAEMAEEIFAEAAATSSCFRGMGEKAWLSRRCMWSWARAGVVSEGAQGRRESGPGAGGRANGRKGPSRARGQGRGRGTPPGR